MAETLKVLGQSAPSSGVLTNIYTVPASTTTTVSSIVVCNQNNIQILFRISVSIGGAGDTPAQYLYYDTPLNGNQSYVATIGVTLGAADIIRVQTNIPNVSFNVYGVEVS